MDHKESGCEGVGRIQITSRLHILILYGPFNVIFPSKQQPYLFQFQFSVIRGKPHKRTATY